jgi:DNA replication protein DnaC
MTIQQTLDRMRQMRLSGMVQAYERDSKTEGILELSFEDRLALMVDNEWNLRETNRIARLRKRAQFRVDALPEDIDYHHSRGLKRTQMQELLRCNWIRQGHNVLISGPTGVGKTFLACAIGNAACQQSLSVRYYRIPQLLRELLMAQGDGQYLSMLKALRKVDLLILDDWGLANLSPSETRDLLEVLEDRSERRSTLAASQLPLEHWYQSLGDSTVADAIMDRIIHNSYKLLLRGESMRKNKRNLGSETETVRNETLSS